MNAAVPTEPLPIDRVDVWHVDTAEASSATLHRGYLEIMEEHEREQAERFLFEEDRLEYRIARALARSTLSKYVARDPADWRFAKNEYGRPELDPPCLVAGGLPLRFNLTHTRGLVACAVVAGLDVGVDAENNTRADVGPRVADHFFSPLEVAALAAVPEADRAREFFVYWTLKEAYIKARGMGLSLPLESFSFELADRRRPRIVLHEARGEHPDDWQFALPEIDAAHQLALAVRRGARADLAIRLRPTVPRV